MMIWQSVRTLFILSVAACLLAGLGRTPVWAQGTTLDICPTDYGSFPEDAPQLTCRCSADAVKAGNVYGANPYFYQSSLCRAALHAGAAGTDGGEIVVSPEKAAFYPAVSRNGVEAGSYGQGMGFRIAAAPGGTPAPASTAGAGSSLTLDICPTDYGSFPEDAPQLTCRCSADAVKAGNVYGANPYFYQSSLCRAALHAGAAGADGGEIVVSPEKAAFYPAVSRNGVEAGSYGQGMGFRIATAAGGTPAPASTAGAGPGMTLDICPTDYGSFPEDAPRLTCRCSADAVKAGNVYGPNPYFYQSSLCRAALHAGAVPAGGGEIVVSPERAAFYPAISGNGVDAGSYGQGMGFRIAAAPGGTPAPASTAGAGPGMTLDICPTDYGSFPEDAPRLTCRCSADAVKAGNVYGPNPYFYQSSLCRAALHAGAAGAEGGEIVVSPERVAFYPAVSRNGVDAGSYSQGMGFRIATTAGVIPGLTIMAGDSSGMTLDICPTDYGSFPEDAPQLTCRCSADAVKAGNIYGPNPYFYQSSLCRAALHAGAVPAGGGEIVVSPERAAFYPAISRNGVDAGSYGEGMGFHVAAVPPAVPATTLSAPGLDAAGKPIQAPIAETLRETGRVQLYINFATDQDKPLPSSEPILQELLATLQGDEALRVELIGHTDSQGSAPYNSDLSQRRAASVYLWLVQHGVDPGRLRSDGRGLMEPIADNATDSGRALNRRVEVKAVN